MEITDSPHVAVDWRARSAICGYALICGTVLAGLTVDDGFWAPASRAAPFVVIPFVVLVVALCAHHAWAWFTLVAVNAAVLFAIIIAAFFQAFGLVIAAARFSDLVHLGELFVVSVAAFLVLVSPPVQRYASGARPTRSR